MRYFENLIIKLGVFLLFTVCFLLFTSSIYASEEFSTNYQTTYILEKDALVKVEQEITLTNKLGNIYASEYLVTLPVTNISKIWAQDIGGSIYPKLTIDNNKTTLQIIFNEKVYGKDKSNIFKLGYITSDYANLSGKVMEITIPRFSEPNDISQYQVILQVPKNLGKPIILLPQAEKIADKDEFNLYYFSKKTLAEQSIYATFGESQIFDFKLSYHLENKNGKPQILEISIPPDTPFQKIYLDEVNPLPLNIIPDQDGNWMASYELKPQSRLDVSVQGTAETFLTPKTEIKKQPLADKNIYLQAQKYWEVDDQQIKDTAKNLGDAQSIFDYVVNYLSYDYQKLEPPIIRTGALSALNNPKKSVCTEFTDLFIALSRSKGIPAREVEGFGYTNNAKLKPLVQEIDILHAWPEYYDKDKELWLSIDPTWTNTTLGIDFFNHRDLNRIGFVFHGVNSDFPNPAGSYKLDNLNEKDVEVNFGEKPKKEEEYNLTGIFPKKIVAGSTLKGNIKITNLGNTAIYNELLSFKINNNEKPDQLITVLLPKANIQEEINLGKTNFLASGKVKLKVNFKNISYEEEIEVLSGFRFYFIPAIFGGTFGFLYFLLLLKLGHYVKKIS